MELVLEHSSGAFSCVMIKLTEHQFSTTDRGTYYRTRVHLADRLHELAHVFLLEPPVSLDAFPGSAVVGPFLTEIATLAEWGALEY